MASIDVVLDSLKDVIGAALAPYQPEVLPDYPNDSPLAGTIPPTLTAAGYAIQVHVMRRLENKMASVAIFDMKVSKPFPFVNREPSLVKVSGGAGAVQTGVEYFEVAREKKLVCVQTWAPTRDIRRAVSDIIRASLRDSYRIHHAADGSVTILKFVSEEDRDQEQADSVYQRELRYEADITTTIMTDATLIKTLVPRVSDSSPIGHKLTVDIL